MWPDSTESPDHQAVNHFQVSAFWRAEQAFPLSHWKASPRCLKSLVSLENCGLCFSSVTCYPGIRRVLQSTLRGQGSSQFVTTQIFICKTMSYHL